jgi:tetratricopeptide (TPR) repeat protein
MTAARRPANGTSDSPVPGARLRRWPALLLLLAGLLAAPGVGADQKDPRLDALFAELKSAESADAAAPVEAQIWEIWLQSGDAKVDAVMAEGIAALDEADYDTALAAFSDVVAQAPEFAEGWNKRATTLYLMGRLADSIADIGRVLALEPRHFGALSGLGLCNVQLEKDQAALDAFQRALAVDPNSSGVKRNIEELKKRIERHSI